VDPSALAWNPYRRLSVLRAESVLRKDETVLENVYFTAPLKILPAHPAPAGGLMVTQLSVSAGLMAGDRQEIRLNIGEGTRLLWTTQSFEKVHKMAEGAWAERDCGIVLEGGAFLDYRPLPLIPFGDSDFRGRTRVDLAGSGAALAYSDIFCAGRVSRGELFCFRRYQHLLEIRRGGELLFRENTGFRPAFPGLFSGPGFFEGHTHLLTIVLCGVKTGPEPLRAELDRADSSIAAALSSLGEPAKGENFFGGNFLIKALGRSAEELESQRGRDLGSVKILDAVEGATPDNCS
jgi:urease accessory protein